MLRQQWGSGAVQHRAEQVKVEQQRHEGCGESQFIYECIAVEEVQQPAAEGRQCLVHDGAWQPAAPLFPTVAPCTTSPMQFVVDGVAQKSQFIWVSFCRAGKILVSQYPINQNQLKNQFYFVWFGHTKALRKEKK